MSLLVKQLNEIKAKYPDALVMFQCGGYIEIIKEDAVVVSGLIGSVLTENENYKMTGFKGIEIDKHFKTITNAGYRIALITEYQT